MSIVETKIIGRWLTWGLLSLLVLSLVVWVVRRDRLPWTIRIASGESGGQYHDLGESIEQSLAKRLGRKTELQSTDGSIDNFHRLQTGRADLAIIQGGSTPLQEAAVVTPLYPEWMLVVARKGGNIRSATDLVGHKVAIGKKGSGMNASARNVLQRLGIALDEIEPAESYFKEMLKDESIDAALITTGAGNRDVRELLASHEFLVVPILDAHAIELMDPYFRAMTIPRGALGERPAIPDKDTQTIATTSFLAASPQASDRLVSAALAAIHEENLRLRAPMLIARSDAAEFTTTTFHPVAQRYFQPADQIGLMANVMETLAAGKELLFALGAGIYLVWRRWRRLKELEIEALLSKQKEHLDQFLERTLRIERSQMKTNDVDELCKLLNEVTDIKLQVLHEFTEEELRGDHVFRIFLMQCANLIGKIQLKIIAIREP